MGRGILTLSGGKFRECSGVIEHSARLGDSGGKLRGGSQGGGGRVRDKKRLDVGWCQVIPGLVRNASDLKYNSLVDTKPTCMGGDVSKFPGVRKKLEMSMSQRLARTLMY